MRRPTATPPDRAGRSLLEVVLVAGIAALAAATLIPLARQTQEAIIVEETALQLKYANDAVLRILTERNGITNRADVTYGIVTNALAGWDKPPFAWPAEADLASFDAVATNGPSMNVRLRSGARKVTPEDVAIPR